MPSPRLDRQKKERKVRKVPTWGRKSGQAPVPAASGLALQYQGITPREIVASQESLELRRPKEAGERKVQNLIVADMHYPST